MNNKTSAARKKKTAKKTAVVKKKKVKKKKAAKKNTARKTATAKKASAKKPTRKKALPGKPKAVKKSAKKASKTVGKTPQSAPGSGRKKKIVKSKYAGLKVKIRTGRRVGERGVIARQDAYLGTFFVNLDSCQNDPVYSTVEWGPYFEAQLEFSKK